MSFVAVRASGAGGRVALPLPPGKDRGGGCSVDGRAAVAGCCQCRLRRLDRRALVGAPLFPSRRVRTVVVAALPLAAVAWRPVFVVVVTRTPRTTEPRVVRGGSRVGRW